MCVFHVHDGSEEDDELDIGTTVYGASRLLSAPHKYDDRMDYTTSTNIIIGVVETTTAAESYHIMTTRRRHQKKKTNTRHNYHKTTTSP